MSKRVTQADIDNTIDMLRCLALDSGNKWRCLDARSSHCRTCTCLDECEHPDEWECVAAAIGAKRICVTLYLDACGTIRVLLGRNEEGAEEEEYPTDGLMLIANGESDDELEAAQMLEEGWLPSGYYS